MASAVGEPLRPGEDTGLLGLLPNGLSLLRAALGMCFPWLPPTWWPWVVVAAAVSDVADGPLSRLLAIDGKAGRYLDPAADKVFLLGVVVALVRDGLLSVPEVVLLGLRDLLVVAGTVFVLARGKAAAMARLSPSLLGKGTTAAQLLFLGVLLVGGPGSSFLFVAAASLSGLAAADYLRRYHAADTVGAAKRAG